MSTTEQQLAELKAEVIELKKMITDLSALITASNAAVVDEFRKANESKPVKKSAAKATDNTDQPAAAASTDTAPSKDGALKEAKEYFNTVWKTLKGEKDAEKLPKREALRTALAPILGAAFKHDDYTATLSKADNEQHSFKVATKLCTIMFKMASDNTKSKTGMTTDQLVKTILDVKSSMDAASKSQSQMLSPEQKTPEEDA